MVEKLLIQEHLQQKERSELANMDLEFFQVVMGWNVNRVEALPSFSVAEGDLLGWALLNRELQRYYLVKEARVANKYLVVVQRQKGNGVAVGESHTLAQATTLALINASKKQYADFQQIQEIKQVLANKNQQIGATNKWLKIFQIVKAK